MNALALWSRFSATPFGELLTRSALSAHPADVTAPLGVRFAGRALLALHLAADRAATVRVQFDAAGVPRLGTVRHLAQRSGPELADVIRSEATALDCRWVAVVLTSGWQVCLGSRAARPEPGEPGTPFGRFKLPLEAPELFVAEPQPDRLYSPVDHPLLDRSVVFSVRRAELEDVFAIVHRCGLEVATVRIALAAQLETWLEREGEAGLTTDVLVTDGLGALLINVAQRDFVAPVGAAESQLPRQSVQRPRAIAEDIARFVVANGPRPLTFLGPDELREAAVHALPGVEVRRPERHPAHEAELAVLGPAIRHEFKFDAREVRPAVSAGYRRAVLGALTASVALMVLIVANLVYALRAGYECYQLERDSVARSAEMDGERAAMARLQQELGDAVELRSWIAANYHAQPLCHRLLRDIPMSAALDRLVVEARDGQLTVTFVVLGDQDTQLNTHRAVERAIGELRFKIASEELPVATAGAVRGIQYRMHLLIPDAGEGVS